MTEQIVRCLSWVAVSSEPQSERSSPDDQSRGNREFVESLGRYYPGYRGLWAGEIRLVGSRSILSLERACRIHKEYAQLLELIEERQFDVLVTAERDRLGREPSLIMQLELVCLEYDIVVVPRFSSRPLSLDPGEVRNNLGATFSVAVEAAAAKTYIQQLMRRRRDGMMSRWRERKLFASNVPYGYRYRYDEDGTPHIETDETARAIIREVLIDLYLHGGKGARFIMDTMNQRGVPAPGGGKWNKGSLLNLLDNAYTYAGQLEINKYSDGPYYRIEGKHEPFLTLEEAEALYAERKRRRPSRATYHTTLSGICVCTGCGKPMVSYRRNYRGVRGTSVYSGVVCKNEECQAPAQMRGYLVMDMLRATIRELQAHSDLSQLVPEEDQKRKEELERLLEQTRRALQQVQNRQSRLLDLYLDAKVERNEFEKRNEELGRQRNELEKEIAAIEANMEEGDDPAAILRSLEEIRDAGLVMLDLAESDPERANAWLRAHFRLYIRKARIPGSGGRWDPNRIVRIEYVG